jgi:hypothetical protein
LSDGEEAAPLGLEPGSGRGEPAGTMAPGPGGPVRPKAEAPKPEAPKPEGPKPPDGPTLTVEDAEPEYLDERPTMPPASRVSGATLRWATHAGRRPARAEPAHPARAPAPAQVVAGAVRPRPSGTVERQGPTLHDVPDWDAPRRSPRVEDIGTQPVPVAIPGGPTPSPWAGVPSDDEVVVGYALGPRPRRRLRGRWAMVLFVLLVALALALAGTGFAGMFNSAPPTSARHPKTVSLKGDTARAAFSYLLATSADANRLVRSAVGEACLTQAPGSPGRQRVSAQLSKAAAMSRSVVSLAASVRVRLLAMPGGEALVALLDGAAEDSVAADIGYKSWVKDLQATGCYSAPTNDLHYIQAQKASAAGVLAQRQLTALRASLAAGQKGA